LGELADLVREHREEFGLNACLRAMDVSKGTWHYREERRRQGPDPEEEALRADVVDILHDHPGYGRRRIQRELRAPEPRTWRIQDWDAGGSRMTRSEVPGKEAS